MRRYLRALAAEGRAVLVSSHLMSELQDTADHLVVVGRGAAIADTSVAALIAAASGDRIQLRTTAPDQVKSLLNASGATVTAAAPDVLIIDGVPSQRLLALLSEHAIPFTEITAHRVSLEEAYMSLARDAAEFRTVA